MKGRSSSSEGESITVATVILVVLIVVVALSFVGLRNSIVTARNACDAAWSGIDVQLKRRHDLLPNLVETVKGYASHEREVFEKVTEARAEAMKAAGVGQTAGAEQQLTGALADLRAVAENYPQLRATENFQQLSANLSGIEEQIQAARTTYNADVRAYNTKIQVFPNSLVARPGGFRPREYFEIEDAADREPSTVRFSR
ncbi:MAG: LemA family protein [Actinobacteria bacterium]|nr:LemA family protein [Actinomycetota bacterium]